jgi:hypothetical protein
VTARAGDRGALAVAAIDLPAAESFDASSATCQAGGLRAKSGDCANAASAPLTPKAATAIERFMMQ